MRFDPEVNRRKLQELEARVNGKIALGLGCDFHLSFDNIDDALKNPHKYTINQKNYLLVEFADLSIPQQMTQVFHDFLLVGIQPIITHPERNLTIQKTPARLDEWLAIGCVVQVTAASLTGRFGKVRNGVRAQAAAAEQSPFSGDRRAQFAIAAAADERGL